MNGDTKMSKNKNIKDCYCRDQHGELKKIYTSHTEAKKHTDYLWDIHRKRIEIYKCSGSNWHLSSAKQH
jgi:hypothetical protein